MKSWIINLTVKQVAGLVTVTVLSVGISAQAFDFEKVAHNTRLAYAQLAMSDQILEEATLRYLEVKADSAKYPVLGSNGENTDNETGNTDHVARNTYQEEGVSSLNSEFQLPDSTSGAVLGASISATDFIDSLRNVIAIGLPEDILSQFRGPRGEKGDKGDSTYVSGPVQYSIGYTVPSAQTPATLMGASSIGAKEINTGDITVTETLITTTNVPSTFGGPASFNSNVTIGDSSSDSLTINSQIASDMIPATDNTYTIGNSTNRWSQGNLTSLIIRNDNTDTNKATFAFSSSVAKLSTDSATPLQLTTGANSGLYINTTGNVGVGTASPGAELDVTGSVLVSGNYNSTATVNNSDVGLNVTRTAETIQDGSANTGSDYTVTTKYVATKFVASDAHTVGDFQVRIKESADITNTTATLTGYIYTDNAGQPGSIFEYGNAVAFGTLTSTYQVLSFGTATNPLTSGSSYWLVLKYSAAPVGGSIVLDSTTEAGAGATSADGTTWANTTAKLYYVIRGYTGRAITASSTNQWAVYGSSVNGVGVYGLSTNERGLLGNSTNNIGVYGTSTNNRGVYGSSTNNDGVYGYTVSGNGVYGYSSSGNALYGVSSSSNGVYGASTTGYAGQFSGGIGTRFTLGTRTTAAYIQHSTATWNAAGVVFTGNLTNITNTASAAGSLIEDWQVGSVSKFKIDKDGNVTTAGNQIVSGNIGVGTTSPVSLTEFYSTTAPEINITAGTDTTTIDPVITFRSGATPTDRATIGYDYSAYAFKIALAGSLGTATDRVVADSSGVQLKGSVGVGDGFSSDNALSVERSFSSTDRTSIRSSIAGTAGMNKMTGIYTAVNSSSGTMVNSYPLYVANGTGTITNQYGLYIENMAAATNNWAIYSAGGRSYFAGNVGIGTTSPQSNFHISSTTPGMILSNSVGGASELNNGYIDFLEYNAQYAFGSAQALGFRLTFDGDGNKFYIKSTHSGTVTDSLIIERDNGYVGISNVSPSVALDVTGDIEYSGTITDVSDQRLKENIVDFGDALPIVQNIRVKNYNMIGSTQLETGFIAQNVQEYFPQAVSMIDPVNGYLGVSYVSFIPVLAKAVQELDDQLNIYVDENQTLRIKNQESEIGITIHNIKSIALISGSWSVSEDGVMVVKEINTEKVCWDDICLDKATVKALLERTGLLPVAAQPQVAGATEAVVEEEGTEAVITSEEEIISEDTEETSTQDQEVTTEESAEETVTNSEEEIISSGQEVITEDMVVEDTEETSAQDQEATAEEEEVGI
jgi:hypothetical protein